MPRSDEGDAQICEMTSPFAALARPLRCRFPDTEVTALPLSGATIIIGLPISSLSLRYARPGRGVAECPAGSGDDPVDRVLGRHPGNRAEAMRTAGASRRGVHPPAAIAHQTKPPSKGRAA